MKYNPEIHHRRSIRLKEYDYATTGAYFVTVCVHDRECLFGETVDGVMRLNSAGEMVRIEWEGLPERFPNITMDEYVIMPNHFHGIIIISDVAASVVSVGAPLATPAFGSAAIDKGAATNQGAASSAPTLGSIMRTFKSISAIDVNRVLERQGRPLWQRNYYERVIRDDVEMDAARRYILENPLKWNLDRENPANAEQTTETA